MSLEQATDTLRSRVGADCGLGATLKFDCGDDGVVVTDGRSEVAGDMAVALKPQRVL